MPGQERRPPARVLPPPLRVAAVAAALLLLRLPANAQSNDDGAPTPWIYPLPDGSALTMELPPGWTERSASAAPGQAHFSSSASRCEVQIAISPVAGSNPSLDDPDAVRALVDTDARDYLDRAVEGHYTLRELRGPESAGWYFALRQRQPPRKQSEFVNRGAIRVGSVILRFSIETPKPDLPEVRQALKMLAEAREMRAAPARVPDATQPETATAKPPSLASLVGGGPRTPDRQAAADPPDPSPPPPAPDPDPSSSARPSQAKPADPPASSDGPPLSAVAAVLTLAPGARGEARLVLAIRAGWRILAHGQNSKYLQGALLTVEPAGDVIPEEPVFPASIAWRYQPEDPEVKTYEGTVVVRIPVRVKAGSAPGSRVIKGRLRYQTIESARGFFGKTAVLPITIPVTVGRTPAGKN